MNLCQFSTDATYQAFGRNKLKQPVYCSTEPSPVKNRARANASHYQGYPIKPISKKKLEFKPNQNFLNFQPVQRVVMHTMGNENIKEDEGFRIKQRVLSQEDEKKEQKCTIF
jgi:hypothetical protein